MTIEYRARPSRRATALLAAFFGALLALALLAVPVVGAASIHASRSSQPDALPARAAANPYRPQLASTAPMTIYLPILMRKYPPVVVLFDDFDDPASGWPWDASSICNPHTNDPITFAGTTDITAWWRGYNGGEYQFFIPPANATAVWFCQPDALAPWIINTDIYTVETLVRYVEGKYGRWDLNPWWDNAGLIFGANEANTQLFMICLGTQTYDGPPYRTIKWNIHANTPYPYKVFDVPDKPYYYPYRGCSEDALRVINPWLAIGINNSGYNHLMAAVNGDTVKVFINGQYMSQWTLPGLAATTRVGVIGGPYEATPSDIRFAWFKATLEY